MDKNKNYEALKQVASELGAVAFGVCDISQEKRHFNLSPEAMEGLDFAISIAVRLSKRILGEIVDRPTKLYFHHYRQANNLLDHITMRLTAFIQARGYNALPIPASQIVDWQKQTSQVSHKRIAELAGVGWLGLNNLIVHSVYGAHIRLATVLTDMPLLVSTRCVEQCGDCTRCIQVCPVGAIKEARQDFDHMACFEKLKLFQKQKFVDQYICGICVKACNGKK